MIQPPLIHLTAAVIGAFAVVILALAVFFPQAAQGHSSHETRTQDEPRPSSLVARVPISEIRDGLIVRRDGSFCAGWECSGVATEFADAERLEAVSSALDAFIKNVRHPEIELQFRYVIEHETRRLLEERKRLRSCANSPAAWLEENRLSFWRSAFDAGQIRSIRLLALLSWKPKQAWETRSTVSRFAAAFWQGLVHHGFGELPSVFRSAAQELGTKVVVQRNREEHNRLVTEFNQIVETYRIGLQAITSVRRLSEAQLLELVYHSLNPADQQVPKTMTQSASLEYGLV
jgi:hypothetical protein